jgi:hypothetical protein
MKRVLVWTALAALLAAHPLPAQTSVEAIEQDLQLAKQQHDQASSQVLTKFLTTLDAASQSGGIALDLYKNAGGNMPDLSPVRHHYEYETPSEKAAREALDAQSYATVAIVVQIHCGLMRNAALLVLEPKSQEVHDQWITWLKTMAQVYPQLAGSRALKGVSMRDSVISNYLGFHGWGNSEEGGWTINDMPQLYRQLVLEPLRKPPGPGTLDAWDTYIAMLQADDPDHDHFTNAVEPPLDFDRTADDFAIEPTLDKLTQLDQIIKANQGSDHLDDWIARTRKMIAVYQAGGETHSATPGSTSSGTSGSVPGATPGTASSGGATPTPAPTPGTTSANATGATPMATPGSPSASVNGATPVATPGSPPVNATVAAPAATPGATPAGVTGAVPAPTPGTPASGGGAPLPAATP